MALKDFCKCLQSCAAQLEVDLRININDFNNLIHETVADETKIALEQAKNYHYTEIIDAVGVILEKVKMIIFHQGNLEWLNNSSNFTVDDLKRFSYVTSQVYNFSHQQAQEKAKFSKSEQNLSISYKVKRERRRTASEVSLSTLEAWENYLEQKEKACLQAESLIKEEIKKPVAKRTFSNARARKKFVSSTFGGFLDDEANNKEQALESICEDSQQTDENNTIMENKIGAQNLETENLTLKNDKILDDILDKFFYKYRDGEGSKVKKKASKSCEDFTTFSHNEVTIRSKSSDNIIVSDGSNKYDNMDQQTPKVKEAEDTKPKIVDVIFKSNPTLS